MSKGTKLAQEPQKKRTKKVIGRPFEKGNKANPGGRPKGATSFKALMLRIGLEPSTKDPSITKDEYVTRSIYEKAEEGDKWAQQFVIERREGKPSQSIDVTDNRRETYDGDNPEDYLSDRLSQRQGS